MGKSASPLPPSLSPNGGDAVAAWRLSEQWGPGSLFWFAARTRTGRQSAGQDEIFQKRSGAIVCVPSAQGAGFSQRTLPPPPTLYATTHKGSVQRTHMVAHGRNGRVRLPPPSLLAPSCRAGRRTVAVERAAQWGPGSALSRGPRQSWRPRAEDLKSRGRETLTCPLFCFKI